jgi:2-keto-4-pentenoate hydratase
MTPQDIEKAADTLHAARNDAKLAEGLAGVLMPTTLEEGYAIQAAVIKRRGAVAGWKIAGITPEQRKTLGIDRPIAAPIFVDFVQGTPAKFQHGRFVAPAIEGEFAFVLGRDLPPRSTPYSQDEVLAAVGAIVPGVEITDRRVANAAPPLLLADCFGNGAYVRGSLCTDWKAVDMLTHNVTAELDGREIGRGTGAAIPGGGPVNALMAIANNQPPGQSLQAGQFVTTGTCTGQVPVAGGREVTGNFGRLGTVLASFAA